ncbi:MAG: type II toxin-antitoxin system prevent-host-death family antitoxin [Acidobacteria bacterium]|nr:type II toxin-antitoxin system prevent-host-death family antitoxin [Acidobacteriota bacterium]
MASGQSSNTVGAYEAKTHLSKLLEKVEAGEEITITKHGVPVGKLVPVEEKASAEQRAALLNRLATEPALVPTSWFIEITNVLAMAERKGRITATQSDAFIADLSNLGIERDEEAADRAFTHLLALCRTHRLTSYDAIYLDLAVRRRLPLATLDDGFGRIAKKLGVGILG